jgi:uncharacterized protein (TIGR02466 family)|tara:strand:+ start:9044 stop:9625 length:582 start_codon:yes stop_codon:yes gene_type:complete
MIENYFGIPVKLVDTDNQDVINEAVQVAETQRSNTTNPWSSDIQSTFKFDEYINVLKDQCPLLSKHIYKHIHQYLAELAVDPPYTLVNLDESWYNYSQPGMWQEFHMHPESDISGIFYVTAPKDSGNIMFNPPASAYNFHKLTHRAKNMQPNIWFEPIVGRLLLWPSYLEHMVVKNKSNEERISIAFNVKLIN